MSKKVLVVGNVNTVQEMFKERGFSILYEANFKERPDLVVFTGGPDINPKLYNQERHPKTMVQDTRDQHDLKYVDKYLRRMPKAGICRGGQLLNVISGGSMWQHVNNHASDHEIEDHLFKKKLRVTSTHHQMMVPSDDALVVASCSLATVAESPGRSMENLGEVDVEVCWYENTNSLCFQPHPEYKHSPKECTQYFFDLLHYFFF